MTNQHEQVRGAAIDVHGLHKRFGSREVLHNTELSIAPGEFIAIVGRSGCGKSTLLRLLAGLDRPSQGSLRIGGADVEGLRTDTRIMFQDPRLLPWRRVIDNVTLGLPEGERARGREVLGQVGLADRADDWPARFSGGQKQRVALARALVHRPGLLLLDEPLGALDALTRIEMHRLIESLWQRHRFTALLVTHDVQEAVTLADRVVLIEDGRVALDERIALERPRRQGMTGFAAVEARILEKVLHAPEALQAPPSDEDRRLPRPALGLQWAV